MQYRSNLHNTHSFFYSNKSNSLISKSYCQIESFDKRAYEYHESDNSLEQGYLFALFSMANNSDAENLYLEEFLYNE